MAEIFITFIHEEEPVASAVRDFLEALVPETKAFFASDQWQVYAGEDWFRKICDALREAKVVILLLSRDSIVRPWVNFEAGAAWLSDKCVIPCCLKGMSKGNLPKPYSSLQALDLNDRNDQHYLLNSVCHHLKKHAPLTPPPTLYGTEDEYAEQREPYEHFAAVIEAFEKGESIPHKRFFPKL